VINRTLANAVGFLFFFSVFTVGIFSQSSGNPDKLIARVWLERADEILLNTNLFEKELGDAVLNEAAIALDTAAEFRSPGRDALYLKAKLLLAGYRQNNNRNNVSSSRSAYELLSLSLDDHTPTSIADISTFEDRAVLWSSQALRLKEYRELLNRYQNWPRGHQDDPVLMYAAARASLYLGHEQVAAELAVKGEALSVQSTNLGRLGPKFGGGAQISFRALAVAAGDENSIRTLDAAWRRWSYGLEEALQPWLFSGRIDAGTTGNLSELLSSDTTDVLTLLSNPGSAVEYLPEAIANDLAFLRRYRSANPDMRLLDTHTGILVSDSDYDGYPEEYLKLVNGKLDYRKIDKDQDGRYEWAVKYDGYEPLHLQINDGELDLVYEQDAYPSVLNMNRRNPGAEINLYMHPGGFLWECEGPEGFWSTPRIPDWDDGELWYGTRRVTVRVENLPDGVTGETQTYLSSGYPLRADEKRFMNGMSDEPLWIREIIYEDGVAVAGRRSYRKDPGDPGRQIWELYERFENGETVGLAWDPDMTGTPAYLKDWALDRYLETEVWNLDADRWVDVRRFVLPGGDIQSAEILITEARVEDLLPWSATDWAPWDQ
jgi:hypothetical protein